MDSSWVAAVTVPSEEEAQDALEELVKGGIGARIEPDSASAGYTVLVRQLSMGDAVALLSAGDEASDGAAAASVPGDETDPLVCPRCESQGVDVGPPGAVSVFFLQQVLGVPYLRKPCTCMSCGHQWRQYVESF